MRTIMVILALLSAFASLASQACEHGHKHSHHHCTSSQGYSTVASVQLHKEVSISGLKLHLDHKSNHHHHDGKQCHCFSKGPAENLKTDLPSTSVQLPAVAIREIVSLYRVDVRIPPSLAPPSDYLNNLSSPSGNLSQKNCVFLL